MDSVPKYRDNPQIHASQLGIHELDDEFAVYCKGIGRIEHKSLLWILES